MTDLIVAQNNLPTTLEDLSAFVLFNDEKVKAVRAALSAMHKLKAPRDVLDLKLREAQELSEQVALAKIELGKRISEIPKATNNNPTGNNQYSGQIDSTVDSTLKQKPKSETIAELGLTQKQAERFQQMAQNPDAVQAAMTKAREAGDVVSQSQIISEIQQTRRAEKEARQEERRVENAAKVESLATPLEAKGLFQTIVIDPPWDWSDEGDVNQFGRAKPEYSTMPFDEIKNLPVARIADENCHLYLWVTNRSLPKAFALIEAWGFRYITCLTWVKPSIGMGNYFRGSTEQILFAVKGSQPLKRHDVGTAFTAPRGVGHSSKPDEFYQLVESCSYAPFIDIFGRKNRDGWSVWGENG